MKETRTAYLLIRLRERPHMPEVIDVGIYSEESPTVLRGEHYVLVASAVGSSFDSARKRVLAGIAKQVDLQWLVPYIRQ